MTRFERARQKLQIPLSVLPSRYLQYNGGVERSNRTVREEFYWQYQGEADWLTLAPAPGIGLEFPDGIS